ncbi:hypothetical protein LTR85_003501 [Meristemomyces frigidus]|nr:hypothetical protein LTR85_003501 [Meristemomyces frigidus]
MLALPKALQYLHLGENSYHSPPKYSRDYNALCKKDPQKFFAALAQQSHSLQALEYETANVTDDSGLLGPNKHHAGLRNFAKLHTVSLAGMHCPGFEEVLSSPWTKPPNLTTLKVVAILEDGGAGDDSDGHAPLAWTRSMAAALPHLDDVHVAYLTPMNLREPWTTDHEAALKSAEAEFDSRGLTLWIHERRGRSSFFPPYLYGEQPDAERLMYVSDGRGFIAEPPADDESDEEEGMYVEDDSFLDDEI